MDLEFVQQTAKPDAGVAKSAGAATFEALDEDTWDRLVENVPPAIAARDPADFGDFDQVRVADLEAAIRG